MSNIYSRILITGGGGMLARALNELLHHRGAQPVALDRAGLDITDHSAAVHVFRTHQPSLVLNCAAYTKVDLCEQQLALAENVNMKGAATIANLCALHGCKLVHFSTDFVFNGQSSRPYVEDDPTNPLSAYGRTKLGGEKWIRAVENLDYLIIRTAWLYGPGGACFPQSILNAARAGKPLKVVDDQVGSPTFTYDLADATFRLLDAGPRGVFHVVNAGETTWYDFAVATLEEFDVKADPSRTTSAEWKQSRPDSAIRPAYSVLDTSKYTQTTGHMMRDWREALHGYRLAVSA